MPGDPCYETFMLAHVKLFDLDRPLLTASIPVHGEFVSYDFPPPCEDMYEQLGSIA